MFWNKKSAIAIESVLMVCVALFLSGIRAGSMPIHSTGKSFRIVDSTSEVQKSEFEKVIASQTDFSFKLFRALTQQNDGENIFISPISASLSLSLLQNGANGVTLAEFAKVLGADFSLDSSNFNQANQESIEKLNEVGTGNELEIANSLWIRRDLSVKAEFVDANRRHYNADVLGVDFEAPQSSDIINAWVADRTKGKIRQIIDPGSISAETQLLAINSAYFKGRWELQFDPALTAEESFFLPDGRVTKHPLMSNFGTYQYFENDDLQVVSLPYEGRRLSMYVVLPSQESSLEETIDEMTASLFENFISRMRMREGSVKIPRFRQEYEANLNGILQDLGLKTIFNSTQADFSRLSDTSLFVSEVKQKTFVEVNEEGTEAAAVTGINIGITSISIPFQMTVNRPFFFVIKDNETGTILFMGSVLEPGS